MTEDDVKLVGETAKSVLKEYQRSKRRMFFYKIAFVVALAVFIFSAGKKPAVHPKDHIATIMLNDPIIEHSEASLNKLYPGLLAAFENPSVKGVLLLINSPGGTPSAAAALHDEIVHLKTKHAKPVISVCDAMCVSGSYWVALAADEIYANPMGIVGSIGVYVESIGLKEAAQQFKIEPRLYQSGANKTINNPFYNPTPEQIAFMQKQVRSVHEKFIDRVVKSRAQKLPADILAAATPEQDMFSGRFYGAEEGVAVGLIDGLGYEQSIMRQKFPDLETSDYTPHPNFRSMLDDMLHAPKMMFDMAQGLKFKTSVE